MYVYRKVIRRKYAPIRETSPTWRIIPLSKLLITVVIVSPLSRVVGPLPKGHSWLINWGDPNHLQVLGSHPPSKPNADGDDAGNWKVPADGLEQEVVFFNQIGGFNLCFHHQKWCFRNHQPFKWNPYERPISEASTSIFPEEHSDPNHRAPNQQLTIS